ncbi:MAG TPA: iron-containing alcohol dehydrogenase [Tepidisphaeraceae bacterium]|jgi:alcohol dehydrogenase class IV|nr:iron-containing alcohol dehydrogenase [Tepidisphaeraceae bacterium]
MEPFEFNTPGRIVFGAGQISRLAEVGPPFGSVALVIHAGDEHSLDLLRIKRILEGKQIRLTFIRQSGEPKVEDVDLITEKAKRIDCDWVIGVGGGSAIDMAKAVAGLLGNGGSALDYLEVVGKGQKLTKPAAPWIAIPTTAGTGAEATRNAVLTAGTFKASMRSALLLPRVAIVDAELGREIKEEVIASSGMDALCQLIESYTSTGANPMTDALAIQGIELAASSLLRSYQNPVEVIFRERMALAALLSGITLTNAGLGAVHGFAAPLGAHFPIPHGVICAALLPAVINANVAALQAEDQQHPTLARYITIARTITSFGVMVLQTYMDNLLRLLKIPPLRKFGLTEAHIPLMISLARQSSSMKYNPVQLSDEALAGILRAGIVGYPDAKSA